MFPSSPLIFPHRSEEAHGSGCSEVILARPAIAPDFRGLSRGYHHPSDWPPKVSLCEVSSFAILKRSRRSPGTCRIGLPAPDAGHFGPFQAGFARAVGASCDSGLPCFPPVPFNPKFPPSNQNFVLLLSLFVPLQNRNHFSRKKLGS